jgi:hypothetical protein
VAGFGISGVEPPASATTMFVICRQILLPYVKICCISSFCGTRFGHHEGFLCINEMGSNYFFIIDAVFVKVGSPFSSGFL